MATVSENAKKFFQNDQQHDFVFEQLPDVLIQDPIHECAYLLPASEMDSYLANAETWNQLNPGTVTFVIPDIDYVEEVPPFRQSIDQSPSVLIQYPHDNKAYFLNFEQLQTYCIAPPQTKGVGYGISFVMPRGLELIEELPAIRNAILQSGEAGFAPIRLELEK